MIDHFALGLSHGLLLLAAWRLMFRPDLEDDSASVADAGSGRGWGRSDAQDPADA